MMSAAMKDFNKKNKPPQAASESKLTRVIKRLSALAEGRAHGAYQEKMLQMNLRYTLSSLEGRLEFIADLITEQNKALSDAEKKAASLLLEGLRCRENSAEPFLDFSIDYLRLALQPPAAASSFTKSGRLSLPVFTADLRSPAMQLLLGLVLSGIISPGCLQKKDALHPSSPAANRKEQSTPVKKLAPSAPSPLKTYTIKKGDSIFSIARRQNVDAQELVRLNKPAYNKARNRYDLHPGQVLMLPHKAGLRAADKSPEETSTDEFLSLSRMTEEKDCKYHLVKKGENLIRISKIHQVPVEKIIAINNIKDPLGIKYGTLIKVPKKIESGNGTGVPFAFLNAENKVTFLKERTIKTGHPYLKTLVDVSEEFKIDPRLYAALVWEESWFDKNAKSKDNCRMLIQLDPRFHAVSEDITDNFRKSLRYLKSEFTYYRKKGFDRKSAAVCALAAYNGGNTRIRKLINEGRWDGRSIETIPIIETKGYVARVLRRCEKNYHAVL